MLTTTSKLRAAQKRVLALMKDESCMTWRNGSMGDFELDSNKLAERIKGIKP